VATQAAAGMTWRSISSGHSCLLAIRSDGSLWATGFNGSGQLGDGTQLNRAGMTRIGNDTDWVLVTTSSVASASPGHSFAIKANGTLWAWGGNASGQLGDGTTTSRYAPVQIGTDTNWRSVYATAGSHTLAIKTDGTLWAWGLNTNGQIGNNTTTMVLAPVQIGGATDWVSAAGGSAHSHAIKTNGTLWGWGLNSSGQLGNGGTTQSNVPVQIGAATNWTNVSSTNSTTVCATRADGTLWVWGPGSLGQFGTGAYGTTNRTSPVQLGTSTAWISGFRWRSSACPDDR
jgi:alpha-tubulin suppressor-like RCC1 family protein